MAKEETAISIWEGLAKVGRERGETQKLYGGCFHMPTNGTMSKDSSKQPTLEWSGGNWTHVIKLTTVLEFLVPKSYGIGGLRNHNRAITEVKRSCAVFRETAKMAQNPLGATCTFSRHGKKRTEDSWIRNWFARLYIILDLSASILGMQTRLRGLGAILYDYFRLTECLVKFALV